MFTAVPGAWLGVDEYVFVVAMGAPWCGVRVGYSWGDNGSWGTQDCRPALRDSCILSVQRNRKASPGAGGGNRSREEGLPWPQRQPTMPVEEPRRGTCLCAASASPRHHWPPHPTDCHSYSVVTNSPQPLPPPRHYPTAQPLPLAPSPASP